MTVFSIPGLTAGELAELDVLFEQLASFRRINKTRQNYDEAKQELKNLGIAIPPHLTKIAVALEWPRAAWKHLANRVNFETFTLADGALSDFGIDRIMRENHVRREAPLQEAEAFKYGPAFILTLAGGPGEPAVVQRGLSPRSSTVLWDPNLRRATALLAVTESKDARAVEFIYANDEFVHTVRLVGREWQVETTPTVIGRCPVSVLPHAPDLENPLGRSRITQGVMATTDRAMRTLLRMELTAEFFSAPQRYLLGADSESFVDADGNPVSGWSSLIGRWNAIARDEDGELPTIWQAPQSSMQPHIEMLRSDAAVFAGITNIPMHALGIVHDNPASSEALESSYSALDRDAEAAVQSFSDGRVDSMHVAVMVRDGLTEVPEALWGLEAKYRPTSLPTVAAAADAMVKRITALPWLGETEVALEGFGYDRPTRDRLMSEKRRLQGRATVEALVNAAGEASDGEG